MAKVNWTAEAEGWLRDIHDYIAADNPEAASRVVEGIYSRVELLERFPLVAAVGALTELGRVS
jgi:plasmid stabilization system protein ParE